MKRSLLGLLLVLPWLYPMASGPSPSVQQWLVATSCAVLVWLARTELQPKLVLQAWVLSATVSSLIALLQYAGQAQLLTPWVASAAQGEAYGNLRQRNQLATLSNIGLVALMWLPSLAKTRNPGVHSGTLVLAALLGVANAASGSRTGLTQLVMLAGLVMLWGLWKDRIIRHSLVIAWVAYATSSLILPVLLAHDGPGGGIWGRLLQEGSACSSRFVLWSNVLELVVRRPWSGWGWGELDYAHFMAAYDGLRFCAILDNAHNLPLQIAVELGVPAALLLVAVVGVWLLRMRPWRASDAAGQTAWALLGLMLLHSMVEYPLWYGPFQMSLALGLWLLVDRQAGGTRTPVSGRRRAMEWSLGAAVLTGLGYAAWDYHRISQIYLPPEQRAAAYRENTLEKIQGSWLFRNQVRFAEYTITPLTRNNAEQLYVMGRQLLHYSPEARVVEKLIECAVLLGRDEDADFYLRRYKAAYPQDHALWAARQLQQVRPEKIESQDAK